MGEELKLVDSLAVKYRPKKFADIIGNEKNIGVITGYFSRRQLVKSWGLFGPSGSGKSTAARLMAMAVNCERLSKKGEPCLKCSSCRLALEGKHVDIKEVNAGSDEGRVYGIDAILDTLKYKPRYNARVVIIDECHLATTKAQQGLLKAVEEPPKGVMFIICTTNPEKLPKALLGRCVKLYFNYPEIKETAKRLYSICKKEFPEEVIEKVKPFLIPISKATHAQVRNSISIMENLTSIVFSKPKISHDDLNTMFRNMLAETGDLDEFAIRYCTYMLSENYSFPLTLSFDLDSERVLDFLNYALKHIQFASTYYLYRDNDDKTKFYTIRRKFWGVNFDRFEKALDRLGKDKDSNEMVAKCLKVASGLVLAYEKLFTGAISADQALIYGITQTMR